MAVLYLRAATGFSCRKCAKVAYLSQSEDVIARAWRKQSKIERRLGIHRTRPEGNTGAMRRLGGH